MSERGDTLRQLAELADEEEEITEELKRSWLLSQPLDSHESVVKNYAENFKLSLTDAKKSIGVFPSNYLVEEQDIPSLVKNLRKHRRTLKGERKVQFTKAIDNLIEAYSGHLDSCVKSIYWIAPYEKPLRNMGFNENDLRKLHSMTNGEQRQQVVDVLCKYWERELERKDCSYGEEYANLSKNMSNDKKEFRAILKNHYYRKSMSERLDEHILKMVCERPGISANQIMDTLPPVLRKRTNPHIIAKTAPRLNITVNQEEYYKMPDLFKKDLYSYVAAFIDSDGYITMDKNGNPRVGLVATGNRGRAFLTELQKSLGVGRLVLDEKSPQDTRLVNRLNFYSQYDITELLNKCRPHFRMKGPQADILMELIRIKKGYKKADWYKNRCNELFKLMKWNNHRDNPNYDWAKYEINVENISKYEGNCKMSLMDDLENISKNVDEAIDELEEIEEEYEFSRHEWASLDDASDYLFEHKGPQGEEE